MKSQSRTSGSWFQPWQGRDLPACQPNKTTIGKSIYVYIYNIIRIIANPLPSEQTTMAPGKSLQDKKTNDPRRNVTRFLGSSWAHQCIADYLKLCSSDRHQKSFLASLFRLNLAASNSLLTLSASASAASELFPKCWSFSCHLVSLRPETLQI